MLDLRNPTRSDENNILHLVNKYMDLYLYDKNNLSAKAKAEKYAKITAKTIIDIGGGSTESGANAYFYDAAEGLLADTRLACESAAGFKSQIQDLLFRTYGKTSAGTQSKMACRSSLEYLRADNAVGHEYGVVKAQQLP